MDSQNDLQIRLLASLAVGLVLILVFILGPGAVSILPSSSPAPTPPPQSTVVTAVLQVSPTAKSTLIAVTPDLKRPTPSLEEMATANARSATALANQARLPPVPTPTMPSIFSLFTPSPSFRLDIWLSTLVVGLGLLAIVGLMLRTRLRQVQSRKN